MNCARFRICGRKGLTAALGLAVLWPALAAAHYPWMTPADYRPAPGATVAFNIGWGHEFPGTATLDPERVEAAWLVDGAGPAIAIDLAAGAPFVTPPLPGDGPWLLAARQVPGFYSRTPRGGQRSSRADNPDALSCGYSRNVVVALLGQGTAIDTALGFPLEIMPLDGQATAGEPLAVRVTLHGRPWRGVVRATYAGFTGGEDEYPASAQTDEAGIARLALEHGGRWMVMARASEPYPDPAICDQNNYNATLTLEVR
ncbi:DUF4198 domain-containing protein [Wenzhouxiangella sp. XN24]|uniref:DUF4198 domain-containing protein n=1 Tax=Wenzhouxiangella sp. XN24 TaxID=2713569 RepID=UPI0013EA4F41|nr:DUF4198 domain-containing protein [Wenzhouxiangella sp. XN24]NGX16881.1 DUF4198 domain-containing protein [Wenzhouxiangella sp. XN24]